MSNACNLCNISISKIKSNFFQHNSHALIHTGYCVRWQTGSEGVGGTASCHFIIIFQIFLYINCLLYYQFF